MTEDVKEIEECRKQAEEYLAGWKRAMADYQNREKEIAREKDELAAYASARSIHAILPVLDHLRAAVAHIPAEQAGSEWAKGVNLIVKEFENALRALGVDTITTEGAFDPSLHESVGDQQAEGVAIGTIVRETQSGYTLAGKVIRPAKVIIAK